MIALIRKALARRRLQRLVERNRSSFELEQFRRRRAAMLKHTRGVA
jgi:hypothetical protein